MRLFTRVPSHLFRRHLVSYLFCRPSFRDSSRWHGGHGLHCLFLIGWLEDAATIGALIATVDLANFGVVLDLGFHEWQVALGLLVSHEEETNDDAKPVQVVRNDRTICGTVGPAEDSIEDTPATTTIQFRIAKLYN
jgi:hypothetical protein